MKSQLPLCQFSVMTAPYLHYTLDYALESIAACGFTDVELWGASPHYCIDDYEGPARKSRISEINRMMRILGLDMKVFHPEQVRQYPINIASKDEEIRKKSIYCMLRYLEDTVDFGARAMVLAPGWEYFDINPDEAWNRAVEAVGLLARRAETLGISMLMETMDPVECNLVTSLAELKRIIRQVGSAALRPCADLPLVIGNGENFEDWFSEFGSIAHIHFADMGANGYTALGDGESSLESQLEILLRNNYSGQVSLYMNGSAHYPNPDFPVRRSLIWLQNSPLVRF